jgi:hypothetical protein
MRAAARSGVYGGYEESGDERRGEKEGISTTGVPFLDVSRWKLDDGGWQWGNRLVISLRVGSGALHHRGVAGGMGGEHHYCVF